MAKTDTEDRPLAEVLSLTSNLESGGGQGQFLLCSSNFTAFFQNKKKHHGMRISPQQVLYSPAQVNLTASFVFSFVQYY